MLRLLHIFTYKLSNSHFCPEAWRDAQFQINLVSKGKLVCVMQQDGKWFLSAAPVIIQTKIFWVFKSAGRQGRGGNLVRAGSEVGGWNQPAPTGVRNDDHLSTCQCLKGMRWGQYVSFIHPCKNHALGTHYNARHYSSIRNSSGNKTKIFIELIFLKRIQMTNKCLLLSHHN